MVLRNNPKKISIDKLEPTESIIWFTIPKLFNFNILIIKKPERNEQIKNPKKGR